MTETATFYGDIFGQVGDDFNRGFAAGVLWQKLRENHDRLDWDPENANVEMSIRLGQILGYRVEVKDSILAGHRHLIFTSTLGANRA